MTAAHETNARRRALLLEDDASQAPALREALEARGFDVLHAADAASGLALLLETLLDLDVLVVDEDLPGRGAKALTHLVRRAGGEQDLALVVVADAAPFLVRAELAALGADAVVERAEGASAVAGAAAAAVASRAPAAEPARAAPPTAPWPERLLPPRFRWSLLAA